MKAIRCKNRADLFVLNGNKKPIQYEYYKPYNGVKPNRYNGFILVRFHSHLKIIVKELSSLF